MNARERLGAQTRRLAYRLLRTDYYTPIPDLRTIPPEAWETALPMPGVDLRLDASLEFLEQTLAPFIREYADRGSTHGWQQYNGFYPVVDGDILYGVVRHLEPRRIVEVGAGWSTRVIRDAIDHGGLKVDHRVFDPDVAEAQSRIGESVTVTPLGARDIPDGAFGELEAGDVLFVDTTHTVKLGGDVNRLLLEVVPALAKGVVVHIHDVYLPFEYPRWLVEKYDMVWQEQYLVQALIAHSSAFEVLMANHALGRLRPERLAATVAGIPAGTAPGSALWMRRV